MSLALLLVAAAQGAAAPAPEVYPAEAVYAAFKEACADVGDLGRARTTLAKAGWQSYEPKADSPAGRLVKLGTDAMNGRKGAKLRRGSAWRRTVAGEQLDLLLSGVEIDGSWVNGCRMYDFAEARELPASVVKDGIGREPTRIVDRPGALRRTEWSPGYAPGHMSTELYFVPVGSPAVSLLGSSGICIVAQATGELS